MNMAHEFSTESAVSEMAIVDTFTKLIFGQEADFDSSEQLIIQAFRLVDTRVELDTHGDMGHYLRALGVTEMIQLVTRVQACLADGLRAVARVRKASVLDRRAH
jgi:hypothetical protein